jgi:hypothetical protein
MSNITIIVLCAVWLSSNLLVPLLIRSMDRLYGGKIDNLLSSIVGVVNKIVKFILDIIRNIPRVIIIIYFLPIIGFYKLAVVFNIKFLIRFSRKMSLDEYVALCFSSEFSLTAMFKLIFYELRIKQNVPK